MSWRFLTVFVSEIALILRRGKTFLGLRTSPAWHPD